MEVRIRLGDAADVDAVAVFERSNLARRQGMWRNRAARVEHVRVPKRRGEGIGGAILDPVLAEAKRRAFSRIRLRTHDDNERSAPSCPCCCGVCSFG